MTGLAIDGAREHAIRAYFAMWVARDFSGFDDLVADGCRYEECHGPVYEGRAELHAWIADMLERQRVSAWDIHELIPAADGATVTVTWTFAAEEERSYIFDGVSLIHFDAGGRMDAIREFGAKHERSRPQRAAVETGGASVTAPSCSRLSEKDERNGADEDVSMTGRRAHPVERDRI